ncbi:MAG: alanine--tRNA ligase [Bacteroidetes bacterium]|nr:alanine--tRNA ligase [Bacteroidota bacterium]
MPDRPTTSSETRQAFLDFFREKEHEIVPSASLVPQDDPTLMFTNAGMNQFKDVFLGTGSRPYTRAADTQKCLRVSGKHNDLEEVGVDTYHHTFFEMLGNWSFGDYFKKEAIGWAWELLVDRWGIDPDRLYATVHEGDEKLGLGADNEAADLWKSETKIPHDHILFFDSKDNFWMMGETGPCGPCSEIHYDMRPDEERAKVDGKTLVNADDPQVMEIWNLVFIQYNAIIKQEGYEWLFEFAIDRTTDPIPDLPEANREVPYKSREEIVEAYRELKPLAANHVDTGMGFERICAVLQGKSSNYDTDVFMPILAAIAERSSEVKSYEAADVKQQIAMRVVADHLRTLAFAIADGAQPGNTGRGYVIRRILRRAVRYGYQTLGFREPFMTDLVGTLIRVMGKAFPELEKNREIIERVICAEEEGFLRTLESGLDYFARVIGFYRLFQQGAAGVSEDVRDQQIAFVVQTVKNGLGKRPEGPGGVLVEIPGLSRKDEAFFQAAYKSIPLDAALFDFVEKAYDSKLPGDIAFLLQDTYGFPIDLTALMAREQGLEVDMERFEELMDEQRNRARAAGDFKVDQSQVDAWTLTLVEQTEVEFIGYDSLTVKDVHILKTRTAGEGEDARHELVLDRTPFYGEAGGQVGDTGSLTVGGETIQVLNTKKDAEGTIVHVVDRLPSDLEASVSGEVDAERRLHIMRHHTATHLLHEALRETLGTHVQQKGSLVAPDRLRFDFSHFERVTDDEQKAIERRVNEIVLRNLSFGDERAVPIDEARERGAMMLFGEKYGDLVRVVTFEGEGFSSIELCGGTHVQATGEVGLFKLTSEGSVASGIRRVEAVAGEKALEWLDAQMFELDATRGLFKQLPEGLETGVSGLQEQTKSLEKELAGFKQQAAAAGLDQLIADAQDVDGIRLVTGEIPGADMKTLSDLGEKIRESMQKNTVAVLGSADTNAGKAFLVAAVTDDLVKSGIQAGKLVGALAKRVGGGGGGRPHLATAGGKQPEKLSEALDAVAEELRALR